ncbi:MAG: hypothetical protein KTR31_17345 [Myxococcales bacterium]|nr:hypothetical protein [Myxococcales bacterium]
MARPMRHTILLLTITALGCAGAPADPLTPRSTGPACDEGETYLEHDVDPVAMELGGVMYPHRWPEGEHRGTGLRTEVDLGAIPCGTSSDIDWSPFDVLLFVSIPAW